MKNTIVSIVIPFFMLLIGTIVILFSAYLLYDWWSDNHFEWRRKRAERKKRTQTNMGWVQSLDEWQFAKWLVDSSSQIFKDAEDCYKDSAVVRWLREKHIKDGE